MKKFTKQELIEKLKNLEAIFLDADGTLTDGGIYLDEKNLAIRRFYAHDGTGITMIKNIGIKVIMLTTSISPIMENRAKILGFDACISGSNAKGKDIKQYCQKNSLNLQNVIHMGDDVNDIPAFMVVGFPISVFNSAEIVHKYTCYITELKGGYGAVREICDFILLAKTGKLYGPPYVDHYLQ